MAPYLTILAFSDWRVQDIDELIEFVKILDEQIDVIIYAGDDVRRFAQNGKNKFEELANYSKYGLFAVIVNDCIQKDKSILIGQKVFDLHKEPQIIDKFIFVGQEGASKDLPLALGSTLYVEDEIKSHLYKMVKGNKDKKIVLVSHSPPQGILDTAIRFRQNSRDSSIGSSAIRKFIEKKKVVLTVCGHCHLMGGRAEKLGRKTVVNIASRDHDGAIGRLAIIKISFDWKEASVSFSPRIKNLYGPYGIWCIYGIGNKYYEKLKEAGIKTVKELSLLSPEEISERAGISQGVVSRWPLQARISLNEETIIVSEIDIQNYVFVDIESNLSGTLILMICVFDAKENICQQFTAYEDSDMEERKILEEFLSFISKYNNLYCYSGSDFDKRILIKRLLDHKMGGKNLPVIKDLCYEMKKKLLTYLNTYELKRLGCLFGFRWRHPNIDGIQIPGLYQQFLFTKNEKLLKNIQEKNQDDVLALSHILSQLKKMQIGKPYSLPLARDLGQPL